MDAVLRAVALITFVGVFARASDIPRAVTSLAQIHSALALVGLLALAVSSVGLVQLYRLKRSGLLIARAMTVVCIPLLLLKYWTNGALSSDGYVSVGWQVALVGLLFSPSAARACGGAQDARGGPTTA